MLSLSEMEWQTTQWRVWEGGHLLDGSPDPPHGLDGEPGRDRFGRTVPDVFDPGSEIANLSIFGYDPVRYYTGRGPLEAASMGVNLSAVDIAFRCNLVTLKLRGSEMVMEDFSAGHITDGEAEKIIVDLNKEMGTDEVQFYAGVSYRHLMVLKNGAGRFSNLEQLKLTPPHDIIGKENSSVSSASGGTCADAHARGISRFLQESSDQSCR